MYSLFIICLFVWGFEKYEICENKWIMSEKWKHMSCIWKQITRESIQMIQWMMWLNQKNNKKTFKIQNDCRCYFPNDSFIESFGGGGGI